MDFDDWTDEAFAAYLAGFTDGEGHVAMPSTGGVRVTLANCEEAVLRGMRDRLGYGVIRSQQQRPHWRRRFVLIFQNAADCESFLRMTLPYLHIKRASAIRVLAMCDAYRASLNEFNERNRQIRSALSAGERGKDIAARFGISPQTVSRVKSGHSWPSERPKNACGLGRFTSHRSPSLTAVRWG